MQRLFIVLLLLVFIAGCSSTSSRPSLKRHSSIETTHFVKSEFSALDGWEKDRHEKSFPAFIKSCHKIINRKTNTNKAGDDLVKWQQVCRAALNLSHSLGDTTKLSGSPLRTARLLIKQFFESHFTPYRIGMSDRGKNLTFNARFTGYYEIELHGTRKKHPHFPYPIHSPPIDLHVRKGCPTLTRKSIHNGSLSGKNLEIAWVNDAQRLYFLHIQGNGIVKLKEGGTLPLVWAGSNGFKFKPLPQEYVGSTLQVMKQLSADTQGFDAMNTNHSYIFFKSRKEPHPVGAQAVMLTPERSAALDSQIYPYGVPIWIETNLPRVDGFKGGRYHRLVIGQDRGGAIKGGGRLDIFFGRGRHAEKVAGGFNALGKMYVLYPKGVKVQSIFNCTMKKN